MNRVNHTTWVDCKVLTKKMSELQIKLMEYASRGYSKDQIYGDQPVVIAMYELHQRIEQCLKNSMPGKFTQ